MLAIMFQMNKKPDSEIVNDVMGHFLFMYYQYMDNYKMKPRDIFEMVDGICFIELKQHFDKKAFDNARKGV